MTTAWHARHRLLPRPGTHAPPTSALFLAPLPLLPFTPRTRTAALPFVPLMAKRSLRGIAHRHNTAETRCRACIPVTGEGIQPPPERRAADGRSSKIAARTANIRAGGSTAFDKHKQTYCTASLHAACLHNLSGGTGRADGRTDEQTYLHSMWHTARRTALPPRIYNTGTAHTLHILHTTFHTHTLHVHAHTHTFFYTAYTLFTAHRAMHSAFYTLHTPLCPHTHYTDGMPSTMGWESVPSVLVSLGPSWEHQGLSYSVATFSSYAGCCDACDDLTRTRNITGSLRLTS